MKLMTSSYEFGRADQEQKDRLTFLNQLRVYLYVNGLEFPMHICNGRICTFRAPVLPLFLSYVENYMSLQIVTQWAISPNYVKTDNDDKYDPLTLWCTWSQGSKSIHKTVHGMAVRSWKLIAIDSENLNWEIVLEMLHMPYLLVQAAAEPMWKNSRAVRMLNY